MWGLHGFIGIVLRKVGLDALDIAYVERCIEDIVAPKPVTAKICWGPSAAPLCCLHIEGRV